MVRQRLPSEEPSKSDVDPVALQICSGVDLMLDPSALMLEAAKPRVNSKRQDRGDSEVEFVQGKAEELPFDDNSFDGACSLFVEIGTTKGLG